MASYTVARTKHATLSTTTVDTIDFTDAVHTIVALNRSGTADLALTWASGAAPEAATPVQLADETLCIPAGKSLTFEVGAAGYYQTQIKVLGNANAYTVQAVG